MRRLTSPRLVACLLAQIASLTGLRAQAVWDGGATPDTSIANPLNWNNDTAPGLNGTTGVTFTSANSVATLTAPAAFRMINTTTPAVQFGANFTVDTVAGNALTVYATNSGSNQPALRANSAVTAATIHAPVQVFATAPAASPLGALLTLSVNNTDAANTALSLTGGISLAPGSTAATYDLRYTGANNMTSQAAARIAGPVSGLGTLTNIQGGFGIWAGDLVIAGPQSATATSNITISSIAPNPATTARLVLGESDSDIQAWNNITLNNVMNLAVGGLVSANVFSGNSANARITGASATGTLKLNSGTIGANIALGGPGPNENSLSLVKTSAGTLTLQSSAASYTGSTRIEAGILQVASATTLASPILVGDGAALGGEGATSASLTFADGKTTLLFDPSTPAAFTAASVVPPATGRVSLAPTAALTTGVPYVVLKRSSGAFTVGDLTGFAPGARGVLSLTNSATEITLTPALPTSLVWSGGAPDATYWDVAATQNWTAGGAADRFYAGDAVRFDDTASTFAVEIREASLAPGDMVFDHSANDYVISGGVIAGSGSLTKRGAGTLTLSQTALNGFTGPLSLQGGTLSISTLNQIGGASSTRPIGLDGGGLAFTGLTATTNTTPVVLGDSGGTLSVTGTLLNPDGSTSFQTLRLGAPITGTGDLTKTGHAILAIGQNTPATLGNTFAGAVRVNQGVLDIRNPDALGLVSAGTFVTDANLALFPFGQNAGVTFAAEPITFSGSSYLRHQNEDSDSDIINTLTGPVTLVAGSTLGVSAFRATTISAGAVVATSANVSRLVLSGSVTLGAGSTLSFGLANPDYVPDALRSSATPQDVLVSGPVSGPGSVLAQASEASSFTLSLPGYAGDTTVLGGTLVLGADNPANDASTVSIAASGARLRLEASDTVARLFVGATQLPAGTYGATGSGAATIDDMRFTGPGVLTVTNGPAADPYAAWASGFGLDGPAAEKTADPDADGLVNLIEYALATDPLGASAASVSPSLVDSRLRLTFLRARAELTYAVEASSTLAADSWQVIATNPGAVSLTEPVTVVDTEFVSTTARRFLRLRISE